MPRFPLGNTWSERELRRWRKVASTPERRPSIAALRGRFRTRENERVPVTLKVRLWPDGDDRVREGWTADLSRGGVFVRSTAPIAKGTQVRFQLVGPEGQDPVEGLGLVAWVRERALRGGKLAAGMGIQFIAISDEGLAAFERMRAPQQAGVGASGDVRLAPAAARRRSAAGSNKPRKKVRQSSAPPAHSGTLSFLAVSLVAATVAALALSSDRYPWENNRVRTQTVAPAATKFSASVQPVKEALKRATGRAHTALKQTAAALEPSRPGPNGLSPLSLTNVAEGRKVGADSKKLYRYADKPDPKKRARRTQPGRLRADSPYPDRRPIGFDDWQASGTLGGEPSRTPAELKRPFDERGSSTPF